MKRRKCYPPFKMGGKAKFLIFGLMLTMLPGITLGHPEASPDAKKSGSKKSSFDDLIPIPDEYYDNLEEENGQGSSANDVGDDYDEEDYLDYEGEDFEGRKRNFFSGGPSFDENLNFWAFPKYFSLFFCDLFQPTLEGGQLVGLGWDPQHHLLLQQNRKDLSATSDVINHRLDFFTVDQKPRVEKTKRVVDRGKKGGWGLMEQQGFLLRLTPSSLLQIFEIDDGLLLLPSGVEGAAGTETEEK